MMRGTSSRISGIRCVCKKHQTGKDRKKLKNIKRDKLGADIFLNVVPSLALRLCLHAKYVSVVVDTVFVLLV